MWLCILGVKVKKVKTDQKVTLSATSHVQGFKDQEGKLRSIKRGPGCSKLG